MALLLRIKGVLYYIDATSDYGVSITNWEFLVKNKYYDLFSEIVYRKLHLNRTKELT